MSKCLVFAGAGASTAVNRKSFPTTRDFYELHTDQFRDDPLFQTIARFVQNEKLRSDPTIGGGNPLVDLEEILFVLGEVEETFFRLTQDSGHPAFQVVHSEFMPANDRGTATTSAFEGTAPTIKSLRNAINKTLHSVYKQIPDLGELRLNWLPLLELAQSNFASLDVFTTNYDFVIDTALDFLPESLLDKGHFTTAYSLLGLEIWKNRTAWRPKKKGLYTKLHGSLNWAYGDGGLIEIGGPTPQPDPSKQVAIYPGFKGNPIDEPFSTFHSYLSDSLRAADSILFIGFAFRDQFLNSLFSASIGIDKRVMVVDPNADRMKIPIDVEPNRVPRGFNEAREDIARFLSVAR